MEVGLDSAIPTYSGGLGVLAGDTLRAAADMGVPMVGVTLLHRKGYFRQSLDPLGNQTEAPYDWSPEELLEELAPRISVTIEEREVQIRAWRYLVHGASGHSIPVYLLDTRLEENLPSDAAFTDHLYGGDDRYRLCQEAVLGLGGVAILKALGHSGLAIYHMNEGHSGLLGLALLEEQVGGLGLEAVTESDKEEVRRKCVFTTHTPVPAGHDIFRWELVERVLGREMAAALEKSGCRIDGSLNMTYLGLVFSHYVNGVSMTHEAMARNMFPQYPIRSITNGVHAVTWTAPAFSELYDLHIPDWRRDSSYLRYALEISLDEIQEAHAMAKRETLALVQRRTGVALDPDVLTIGFARRVATYKRADLLFSDPARLRKIAADAGPFQLIYAGKPHPRDEGGKDIIRHIFQVASELKEVIQVVYLEDYDMAMGKCLCSGVDLWLNTPQKPYEASGTSGMKAAINGIPSLSVLDGWWLEGHVEGVTGWSIGDRNGLPGNPWEETASLYDKLEDVIIPMFYRSQDRFAEIMRHSIALNGWFFTAQRMVSQYLRSAYRLEAMGEPPVGA